MMCRKSGQMQMIVMDVSELIPEGHLLKKIDKLISFDFIYDKLCRTTQQTVAYRLTRYVCSKCCL